MFEENIQGNVWGGISRGITEGEYPGCLRRIYRGMSEGEYPGGCLRRIYRGMSEGEYPGGDVWEYTDGIYIKGQFPRVNIQGNVWGGYTGGNVEGETSRETCPDPQISSGWQVVRYCWSSCVKHVSGRWLGLTNLFYAVIFSLPSIVRLRCLVYIKLSNSYAHRCFLNPKMSKMNILVIGFKITNFHSLLCAFKQLHTSSSSSTPLSSNGQYM